MLVDSLQAHTNSQLSVDTKLQASLLIDFSKIVLAGYASQCGCSTFGPCTSESRDSQRVCSGNGPRVRETLVCLWVCLCWAQLPSGTIQSEKHCSIAFRLMCSGMVCFKHVLKRRHACQMRMSTMLKTVSALVTSLNNSFSARAIAWQQQV